MRASENLDKILTSIGTELNHSLDKEELEIMGDIYFRIIYDFYASNKYTLTHDCDPPYDHSGMLVNEYRNFNIDDYNTIGDFLEECTGESRATHISGFGIYYPSFSDFYEDEIKEKLYGVVYDFVATLDTDIFEMMVAESHWQKEYDEAKEEKNDYSVREIAEEVAEYYGFIFNADDRVEKLMEKVKHSDFKYWHNALSDSVLGRLSEDKELARQEFEANQLRISKEKQEFSVMWERLETIYYRDYQEQIPKKIEAPQFHEFLKFLKQNNIKGHDFDLIAKYAPVSFSNSVSAKLKIVALKELSY